MRRSLLTCTALALLLGGCGGGSPSGSAKEHGSSARARVGEAAPDWTAPTSVGGSLSLASFKGDPVYLNFFASWCPPCNEEAPYINAEQKKYADRGLHVIGIDELESAKKAQAFRLAHHLVYPAVVDSGLLQTQYEVNGLPVHVFIGRDGIIRRIVVGEMSPAAIDAAVRAILST